jgi:hypothetical protein
MISRTVLITSIGAGSAFAALQSCRHGGGAWRIIGANSVADAPGMMLANRACLVRPSADIGGFSHDILEIVRDERPKLVVPGRDEDIEALIPLRAELADLGAFLLAGEMEPVAIAGDKVRSAEVLRKAGFPFVRTASDAGEAADLLRETGYPLLAKPRRGYASRGLRIIMDDGDLAAALEIPDICIQEYLVPDRWDRPRGSLSRDDLLAMDDIRPGRMRQEAEVTVHVILGRDGRALGVMGHVADYVDGLAARIDVVSDPEILSLGKAAIEHLGGMGLIGPCNIQGRVVEGRGIVFYELNARVTGLTGARSALGFHEMEAIWRHFVEGEAQVDCLSCPAEGTVLRYLEDVVVTPRG